MSMIVKIASWGFGTFFAGLFFWLIWNFLLKDIIKTLKSMKRKKDKPLPETKTNVDPFTDNKFCVGCGSKLNLKDNFCNSCGTRLK